MAHPLRGVDIGPLIEPEVRCDEVFVVVLVTPLVGRVDQDAQSRLFIVDISVSAVGTFGGDLWLSFWTHGGRELYPPFSCATGTFGGDELIEFTPLVVGLIIVTPTRTPVAVGLGRRGCVLGLIAARSVLWGLGLGGEVHQFRPSLLFPPLFLPLA